MMALQQTVNPKSETKFDVEKLRLQFPILNQKINGSDLVFLDNGASTQKPQVLIDALTQFYSTGYANIHRGQYFLSQEATTAYENVRTKVLRWLGVENTSDAHQIIFTRGTTESLNLVAYGMRKLLKKGDEILLTEMEHHSNIVPWQLVGEMTGATIKVVPLLDDGSLDLEKLDQLLSPQTKILSLTHISNSLGTINPIKSIIQKAKQKGIWVCVDGAQGIVHADVDVTDLDCDFYALSAHKLYGPNGVGILYGKKEALEKLAPFQGGGDMIDAVSFSETTYNTLPQRFEAGTPNIADVIVFGKVLDYLQTINWQAAHTHQRQLLSYLEAELLKIEGLKIIGTARHKASLASFVIDGVHPLDLGTLLDQSGISVRTGHHCTQPVMQRFGVSSTTRASLAMYNTFEEMDRLVAGIHKALKLLR